MSSGYPMRVMMRILLDLNRGIVMLDAAECLMLAVGAAAVQ